MPNQPSTTQRARAELLAMLRSGRKYAGFEMERELKARGIHVTDATATARARDLRKAQYGGYDVRKEWDNGVNTFVYFIPGQQEMFGSAA